jgi:methionyl aminopeptidase
MLAKVLQRLAGEVAPGITTAELDAIAAAELKRLGGTAPFLGHEGFPKSICISVNEAVVHGIPDDRKLVEGDIVGLDFGVRYEKLITDSAVTLGVGQVSAEAQRLLKVTQAALMIGIDQARAGNRVGDISAAVEAHLRKADLGIIAELAGHGVGYDLWEDPQIPNLGRAGSGALLKPGMTIAIEPMATLGGAGIEVLEDNWTIVTQDDSLAAQFEHTVAITTSDPEILTTL